jgi:hypothetical protein
MSQPDFLARPIDPQASLHRPRVSPTYCLRQCPGGFWYLIPYIYEYGFEQYIKAWRKEHGTWTNPERSELPAYAQPVDISRLAFQTPYIIEAII